jgi:hypothetical protein
MLALYHQSSQFAMLKLHNNSQGGAPRFKHFHHAASVPLTGHDRKPTKAPKNSN